MLVLNSHISHVMRCRSLTQSITLDPPPTSMDLVHRPRACHLPFLIRAPRGSRKRNSFKKGRREFCFAICCIKMMQKRLLANEERRFIFRSTPAGPWQPHPYTRGGRGQNRKKLQPPQQLPATTTAEVQELSSSDPVIPMGHRLLLFQNPHLQKFLLILRNRSPILHPA